jgi:hypothetical protein
MKNKRLDKKQRLELRKKLISNYYENNYYSISSIYNNIGMSYRGGKSKKCRYAGYTN